LEHGPSKKGLLLGEDLFSGHEENIYLLLPKFQGGCKVSTENGSEKRLIENGELPCFFLLLVNSWAEYRVHVF
jgi:hypothetical protein